MNQGRNWSPGRGERAIEIQLGEEGNKIGVSRDQNYTWAIRNKEVIGKRTRGFLQSQSMERICAATTLFVLIDLGRAVKRQGGRGYGPRIGTGESEREGGDKAGVGGGRNPMPLQNMPWP